MFKRILFFSSALLWFYFGSWYLWGEDYLLEAGMEMIREDIERDEDGLYKDVIKDKEIKVISRKRVSSKQLEIIPYVYDTQIPDLKLHSILSKEQADYFYETVVRKTPVGGDSSRLVGLEVHIEESKVFVAKVDLRLLPYSDFSNIFPMVWCGFGWVCIPRILERYNLV